MKGNVRIFAYDVNSKIQNSPKVSLEHKYGSWATGGITTLSNGVSYYSGFFGGAAKFGTDSFASTGLTDIFLAEV